MENIDKVNTYYDEFSESASKINEVRHRYSDIISNTYYEDNINLFKKVSNIYLKSVKYKNNSNNI